MGLSAVYVDHEGNSACVMLVTGIVETFGER